MPNGITVPKLLKYVQSESSLIPLEGRVAVIHTSFFFHLFSEERQLQIARNLAKLLSPVPGSMIIGVQVGAREKGIHTTDIKGTKVFNFCHSPESWKHLWEKIIFNEGEVVCECYLSNTFANPRLPTLMNVWNVRRVDAQRERGYNGVATRLLRPVRRVFRNSVY
jgi:hypothetical protein